MNSKNISILCLILPLFVNGLVAPAYGNTAFGKNGAPSADENRVRSVGVVFTHRDFSIELETGEVIDNPAEVGHAESLQAESGYLVQALDAEFSANPDQTFEVATFAPSKQFRGPDAIEFLSRARKFADRVVAKLKNKPDQQLEFVESSAADITPEGDATKENSWVQRFYQNNPRLTWTLIRVSNNMGFRVGTYFMVGGYTALESLALATAVGGASAITGLFYKPINDFSFKAHAYRLISKERFPKWAAAIEKEKVKKVLYESHSTVNWGIVEAAFGAAIVLGEAQILEMLGLPSTALTAWEFWLPVLVATGTQQLWDRYVSRKTDLMELDPAVSETVKNIEMNKRGSIGSIWSVISANAAYTPGMPVVQVAGYVGLATLGLSGYRNLQKIEMKHKEFQAEQDKKKLGDNPCDLILGG